MPTRRGQKHRQGRTTWWRRTALVLLGVLFTVTGELTAQQAEASGEAHPRHESSNASPLGTGAAHSLEGPVDILINLRIGRLAERLVSAVQQGETPFLPAAAFLELSEVYFVEDGQGVLRATRQPGAIDIAIDAPAGRVRFDGDLLEDGETHVLWREGRVMVTPRLLERLLGVTIHTNFSDLHVVVLNPEVLPLGRRLERERRHAALHPPGEKAPASLTLDRSPYRTGGAVLDWSISAELNRPDETALLSMGLGAQLLGGSLQFTGRSVGPVVQGEVELGASYHIAWPRRSALRQLRLGDGLGSGPRPRALRGVHLTNPPMFETPGSGRVRSRATWVPAGRSSFDSRGAPST